MRYIEYMKVCVPLHDDLFDFFYEALPGYEHVGERRILLGCWGAFQDPDHCDFNYKNMTNWGRKMFVTPGVVVDGKLVTNDLVEHQPRHPHSARPLRSTMIGTTKRPSSQRIRWGIRSTAAIHGTCTRCRRPRSATSPSKYSWVMSPRWFDGKDHLALDTGGGPLARLWSTALSGLVDIGYVKATGTA